MTVTVLFLRAKSVTAFFPARAHSYAIYYQVQQAESDIAVATARVKCSLFSLRRSEIIQQLKWLQKLVSENFPVLRIAGRIWLLGFEAKSNGTTVGLKVGYSCLIVPYPVYPCNLAPLQGLRVSYVGLGRATAETECCAPQQLNIASSENIFLVFERNQLSHKWDK